MAGSSQTSRPSGRPNAARENRQAISWRIVSTTTKGKEKKMIEKGKVQEKKKENRLVDDCGVASLRYGRNGDTSLAVTAEIQRTS